MIPRDILAALVRIIAAIALIISLPASSNLAMADGTASATDATHLHDACEVTEKRVSEALKITAGPISKWHCDAYRSDQDFYVLSLHGGSCEPDTICSTLIGYFASRREDGKVYEWNIAEDRLGNPLETLPYRQVSPTEYEIEAPDDTSLMDAAGKACPSGWQMDKRLDDTHWQIWCITEETWPHPKIAAALAHEDQAKPHSYRPPQGFIPDEKAAIRVAEAVLFPVYGEDQIRSEEPFKVMLSGEVWTIEGKDLPPDTVGGVVLLQISKVDGRVIRMTHGK